MVKEDPHTYPGSFNPETRRTATPLTGFIKIIHENTIGMRPEAYFTMLEDIKAKLDFDNLGLIGDIEIIKT